MNDASTKLFAVSRQATNESAVRDLTHAELRSLQKITGYPLISVFLDTMPDLLFGPDEHGRVMGLLKQVDDRLVLEMDAARATTHTNPLRSLASSLIGQRTGEGMAFFAGAGKCLAYRLPNSVKDRVVIDPTFATRDLARSLSENPSYQVLVLGQHKARVFVGQANTLREVVTDGFPINHVVEAFDTKGHRLSAERPKKDLRSQNSFVRRVGTILREHNDTVMQLPPGTTIPLVVFAPASLAGPVRREPLLNPVHLVIGSYEKSLPSRLRELARPGIDGFLSEIRDRSLSALEDATRQRRSAMGINHVWTMARRGDVETLLIDESFTYPAWTTLGGRSLVKAFTAEMPNVLDDAVDEVVEMVQLSGGEVCFFPPGSLGDDGIAAVCRTR